MNPDQALNLIGDALRTSFFLVGPLLSAALVAGVSVGVLQTATQVNEASVSYLAKVIALVAVILTVGPALGAEAMRYTRANFRAIETVVK